ncbi:uncharacterized protein TNCV_2187871 [Trichonephila clavipes]|nr:uncharacterized protein TNCV_2187871 [Trichonephila clavipes]
MHQASFTSLTNGLINFCSQVSHTRSYTKSIRDRSRSFEPRSSVEDHDWAVFPFSRSSNHANFRTFSLYSYKGKVWDDQGCNWKPTVTGSAYINALQLWLFLQLEESEPNNFIRQQDGAPPHWHRSVRDWLNQCTQPMDWLQRASR